MKKITSVVLMASFVFSIASVASAQVGYGGSSGGSSARRAAVVRSATATTVLATTPAAGRVLGATAVKVITQVSQGAKSTGVANVQDKLRSLGFFTYPTSTGYFGPITLAAVKAFQTANGIPATGFVGPLTLAALNK